jgi:hypothetical protein
VELELVTDRTWRPSDVGAGDDVRSLGVIVCSASLDAK